MEIELVVSSEELPNNLIQDLTRELCNTINRETNIRATLKESELSKGDKGDPMIIGSIVLAFFTSGAAVALLNIIKVYFERTPRIKMKLKDKKGKSVSLEIENLQDENLKQTLELIGEFLNEE